MTIVFAMFVRLWESGNTWITPGIIMTHYMEDISIISRHKPILVKIRLTQTNSGSDPATVTDALHVEIHVLLQAH